MTMTRKQLKATRLAKRNRKRRDIRTNNVSVNPMRENPVPFLRQRHAYRLYEI